MSLYGIQLSTKQLAILCVVLLIGLFLRLHQYDQYPQRGATSDEYSYSFLGVSLLTQGVPISWSHFAPYTHRQDLTIKGIYFPIVYPYFDHPPFNGLLVGVWALLHGENTFEKIQLRTIRLMPILFSMVSSVLLFILAFKQYGYKTAIWSLLVYATTTMFVMNGRVVLAENLLTPLFLGALVLYQSYKNRLTTKRVLALSVLCVFAFWTKELGIVVPLTLICLFIFDKAKPRYTLGIVISLVVAVLSYIAYGAYFDWHIFWSIIGMQSGRNVGPETLYYILSNPIIINKIYHDGWYYVGFLSLFFSLFDPKKNKLIYIPVLVYSFLLLFFLTQGGEMGWYIIPLFPFMAIAIARMFMVAVYEEILVLFIPGIFLGQYYLVELFEKNFGLVPVQFRVFLVLLFAPLLIVFLLKKKRLSEKVGLTYFYIFILLNAFLTYSYVHPA